MEEISINLKLRRPAEAREKAVGLAVKYPLSESVSQVTMVALEQSGRRGEALTHYRSLHKRLADELGISPSPALGHLYTRILHGESLLSSASPVPP
jgi:DNA-binding SARP family transcriptional activator